MLAAAGVAAAAARAVDGSDHRLIPLAISWTWSDIWIALEASSNERWASIMSVIAWPMSTLELSSTPECEERRARGGAHGAAGGGGLEAVVGAAVEAGGVGDVDEGDLAGGLAVDRDGAVGADGDLVLGGALGHGHRRVEQRAVLHGEAALGVDLEVAVARQRALGAGA